MTAAVACLVAALAAGASQTNAHMRVRSRSSDVDRKAGVVMLDGDVFVEHSDGYVLLADKVYLFMTAGNALNRVVASGGVVLSNGTRVASCPLAVYRRRRREVEMFSDGKGALARLVEGGGEKRELEGKHIRFWLDSEQVEVSEPSITFGKPEGVVLHE